MLANLTFTHMKFTLTVKSTFTVKLAFIECFWSFIIIAYINVSYLAQNWDITLNDLPV